MASSGEIAVSGEITSFNGLCESVGMVRATMFATGEGQRRRVAKTPDQWSAADELLVVTVPGWLFAFLNSESISLLI